VRASLVRSCRVLSLHGVSDAPHFSNNTNRAGSRPYARIAIMRALDGHSVDWEAGTSATLSGIGRQGHLCVV